MARLEYGGGEGLPSNAGGLSSGYKTGGSWSLGTLIENTGVKGGDCGGAGKDSGGWACINLQWKQ